MKIRQTLSETIFDLCAFINKHTKRSNRSGNISTHANVSMELTSVSRKTFIYRIAIALFISSTVVLSACTIPLKYKPFNNLKTRFTKKSPKVGMLQVIDPKNCPVVEGCGPRYSLLNNEMIPSTALIGDINDKFQGLIISVSGERKPISKELKATPGYKTIKYMIEVSDYKLITLEPYAPLLIEKSEAWMKEQYGCVSLWDKSFKWEAVGSSYFLIVRMTDTLSPDKEKSYIELRYDGISEALVDFNQSLKGEKPCDDQV